MTDGTMELADVCVETFRERVIVYADETILVHDETRAIIDGVDRGIVWAGFW